MKHTEVEENIDTTKTGSISDELQTNATQPIEEKKDISSKGEKKKLTKREIIFLAAGGVITLLCAIVLIILFATNKINISSNTKDVVTSTLTVSTPVTSTVVTTTTSTAPVAQKIGNFNVLLSNPVRRTDVNVFKYLDADANQGPGNPFPPTMTDPDGATEYYSIGKIQGGKYNNYDMIFGFLGSFFESSYPTLQVVVLKNDTTSVILDTYSYLDNTSTKTYKFIEDAWLNTGVKTDTDTSVYKDTKNIDIVDAKTPFYTAYTTVLFNSDGLTKSTLLADGTQTYLDKTDTGIFIKAKTGFFKRYFYTPAIVKRNITSEIETLIPAVTWTTPKTGNNLYQYGFYGGAVCGRSNIGIVNVPMTALKQTGTGSDGNPVYEYTNPKDDADLSKLYSQDYIESGMNKYNTIKEDDTTPFTFDQYVQNHPVFYWKDVFGRMIRFESYEFLIVGGCAKPAVYLYPQSTTQINVHLKIDGSLTYSAPRYENGWNVTANSNGILTDKSGNSFDYLFWEGIFNNLKVNKSLGWMLEKSNVKEFLNTKLDQLGFNTKEKAQFIEYWLPKLQSETGKYLYITFIDEKVMDQLAPLTISPKPDNYKRYFMLYNSENNLRNVVAPTFSSVNRVGFSMFEWGGARIN